MGRFALGQVTFLSATSPRCPAPYTSCTAACEGPAFSHSNPSWPSHTLVKFIVRRCPQWRLVLVAESTLCPSHRFGTRAVTHWDGYLIFFTWESDHEHEWILWSFSSLRCGPPTTVSERKPCSDIPCLSATGFPVTRSFELNIYWAPCRYTVL